MMKTKYKWKCPMENCDYEFYLERGKNEKITYDSYNKAGLHFLLHSDSLYVGSHDFLAWWIDNIPEEALSIEDRRPYLSEEFPIWQRTCYGVFHNYLYNKLNYIKVDYSIPKQSLATYNRDLEDQRNWRRYKKTELYFEKCKDQIIGDLKIGTYKMFNGQKYWYYNKKQLSQTLNNEEIFNFLKEKNLIPAYINDENINNLSLLDKYTIGKIYKNELKNKNNESNKN